MMEWITAGIWFIAGLLCAYNFLMWRYWHPENSWHIYFNHYAVLDNKDWKW